MSSATASEKKDPTASLNRVLAILGKNNPDQTNNAAGTQEPTRALFPSARVRPAIEEISQCGTFDELDAKRLNLKALAKDIFDWKSAPGQTKATGVVVKALAAALMAKGEDGTPKFAQACEMLGFAAAAAPLLQPDRLARLIAAAPEAACAYAPDRYTIRLAGAMHYILKDYTEQRREELLVDLWKTLHDGRFWDVSAGVVELDQGRRTEQRQEERAAHEALIADLLAGTEQDPDAAKERLVQAFLDETLPLGEATQEIVAEFEPSHLLRDQLLEFAENSRRGDVIHPDTVVLMAHIPWATPSERPESPAAWLMRTLVDALEPDPETGTALMEGLPKKPRKWADLYPEIPLTGFPQSAGVRSLNNKQLPGLGDVRIEVVTNTQQLTENARYMGNCTASFAHRMEQGTYILFRLLRGGEVYNASATSRDNGSWAVGELNSRFNRGDVPADIRQAFTTLAGQLPPPVNADGTHSVNTRRFRFTD